jgi:hypothetical protein
MLCVCVVFIVEYFSVDEGGRSVRKTAKPRRFRISINLHQLIIRLIASFMDGSMRSAVSYAAERPAQEFDRS